MCGPSPNMRQNIPTALRQAASALSIPTAAFAAVITGGLAIMALQCCPPPPPPPPLIILASQTPDGDRYRYQTNLNPWEFRRTNRTIIRTPGGSVGIICRPGPR